MQKHRILFGTCLSVAIAATSVRAQATTTHVTVLPSHLSIGDQQFDANLAGFRAYLETTKVSDAPLYALLAPDLDRLESRAETARMVLVAGLVGGAAFGIYAIAGRKGCPGLRPSPIRISRPRPRLGAPATTKTCGRPRPSLSSA